MKDIKKEINYEDLSMYLIKLCTAYNDSVIVAARTDNTLDVSINSGLIRGFCLCLTALGVEYSFNRYDSFTGFEFYDSFILDGMKYILED